MFPVSFSAWQGAKISQLRKHSLTFGDVCDTHTDYSKKYTFLQRGGGGGGGIQNPTGYITVIRVLM